jgi:hypothetical protein
MEYGIFNNDALDYSEEEALEADFPSQEAAEAAMKERYKDDNDVLVHAIEEPDEEDDDDEDFDDDDDDFDEDEEG